MDTHTHGATMHTDRFYTLSATFTYKVNEGTYTVTHSVIQEQLLNVCYNQ